MIRRSSLVSQFDVERDVVVGDLVFCVRAARDGRITPSAELLALEGEKLFFEPEDAVIDPTDAAGPSRSRGVEHPDQIVDACAIDQCLKDLDVVRGSALPDMIERDREARPLPATAGQMDHSHAKGLGFLGGGSPCLLAVGAIENELFRGVEVELSGGATGRPIKDAIRSTQPVDLVEEVVVRQQGDAGVAGPSRPDRLASDFPSIHLACPP